MYRWPTICTAGNWYKTSRLAQHYGHYKPKTHNLITCQYHMSGLHYESKSVLHFERELFLDKFDYELTPSVIDQKLSSFRLLFCTLIGNQINYNKNIEDSMILCCIWNFVTFWCFQSLLILIMSHVSCASTLSLHMPHEAAINIDW